MHKQDTSSLPRGLSLVTIMAALRANVQHCIAYAAKPLSKYVLACLSMIPV
jgi:hypothetical protein